MDAMITLIAETYTRGAIGQQIPVETETPVWATIRSVTRQEAADGGQRGLSPELVAVTPQVNYSGQAIAVVQGVRYGIYRTYRIPDSDQVELYLERKAGV